MMKNNHFEIDSLKIITIFFISWGLVEVGTPFWLGFLVFFYLFKLKIPSASLFWVAIFMFLRALQIASWENFDIDTHRFLVFGVFFMLVSSCLKIFSKKNWLEVMFKFFLFALLANLFSYILGENSSMGLVTVSPLAILYFSRGKGSFGGEKRGLVECILGLCFLIYMKTNYFNSSVPEDERILWLILSGCLFWGVSELVYRLKITTALKD